MTEFRNGISSPIMERIDTGERVPSADLPIGALYAAKPETRHYYQLGPDGEAILCKLPDGHTWYIDSQASNCDMPQDKEHRCWVRHGTVGDRLTIDKNGRTCGAGGGSIKTDRYHGFLRGGRLVRS